MKNFKIVSQVFAVIGILLIIYSFFGRFISGDSVFSYLFRGGMSAASAMLGANTFLLLAILANLYKKEQTDCQNIPARSFFRLNPLLIWGVQRSSYRDVEQGMDSDMQWLRHVHCLRVMLIVCPTASGRTNGAVPESRWAWLSNSRLPGSKSLILRFFLIRKAVPTFLILLFLVTIFSP